MLTPPWWKVVFILKHLTLDGAPLPVTARAFRSPYELTGVRKPLALNASRRLGFEDSHCYLTDFNHIAYVGMVLGSNISTFFHSVLSGFPGWPIQLIRSIALSMVIHYQRCCPNWRTRLDLNQRTPCEVGSLAGSWIKPLSHVSVYVKL